MALVTELLTFFLAVVHPTPAPLGMFSFPINCFFYHLSTCPFLVPRYKDLEIPVCAIPVLEYLTSQPKDKVYVSNFLKLSTNSKEDDRTWDFFLYVFFNKQAYTVEVVTMTQCVRSLPFFLIP